MHSFNEPRLRADALIFDLDGTLADTFDLIVGAWNASVGKHVGRVFDDAEVISRFGIPDDQMIRRELPGPAADEALERYHDHYARQHRDVVKPFEGIHELLSELHRRQVPLGVMTGKGRRSARVTLDALGWSDTFAAVITGDDVTHQKPHPDGPLAAASILNVEPARCAFIGDAPVDIGAGKAAGMITVAAAWHPVYLDEIRKLAPDLWAPHPADLLPLLP